MGVLVNEKIRDQNHKLPAPDETLFILHLRHPVHCARGACHVVDLKASMSRGAEGT